MRGRTIISICGPSGTGKSRLSKAVVDVLGPECCSRLAADYYLVPVPADDTLAEYFQRPVCYDWALLTVDLASAEGEIIRLPDFDFERFQRGAERGNRTFTARQLVATDAIYPYPLADLTVRLTTPDDIRKARVIHRDQEWGTAVIGRWHQLEASRQHLEGLEAHYDLELSGPENPLCNASRIRAGLQEKGLL